MRSVILCTLSEMASEVLFGEKKSKKIDGMNIPHALEKMFDYITIAIFKHPLNALSGGLLGKYKLIKPVKQAFQLGGKIKEAISKEISSRSTLRDDELGQNLLDLCIKHNRQSSAEDKLTHEDIIQACQIFKLAAVDTSRNTTEFMLNHFVNDQTTLAWFLQNVVKKLQSIDFHNYEAYEKSEKLQSFTKEVFRKYGPALILNERFTVKDFSLGKYKVFKGTKLTYPMDALHHSELYYKNAMDFMPERFSSKHEETNNDSRSKPFYLPFSTGKRNCIGRFLGELMV